MVSLALLFRPSTTPLEMAPLALNQFKISGLWRRHMRAIFFMGSMRERNAVVHQVSKNLPAQVGDW